MEMTNGFKWKYFILGIVVSLAVLGCDKKEGAEGHGEGEPIPVAVASARDATFLQSLRLQGSVVSENFALVPAKTGGTIEDLLVDEGNSVTQGQVLCQLDAEKLIRMVETRRQDVDVAKSTLDVNLAVAERAASVLAQAERDLRRFRQLADDKAVTVHRFEEAETGMKAAAAEHKVAAAQVQLSETRVKQSESVLAIAKRDLADATIRAPIDGVISLRYHELGEMVQSGNPVFRIDDPSAIEVSGFAPAQYYHQITPIQSQVRVRVNGVELGEIPVSYKAPTVDERFRTFEVKARIASPPAGVVAGTLADIEIVIDRHSGRGVPVNAVLVRNGQQVVFAAQNGRAVKTAVKIGIQSDGLIEILEGLPDHSSHIIVQGQDLVNDGDAVRVVEE